MKICKKSKIRFNTEALEKLVYDPCSILEDEEAFWALKPQAYARQWAESVNYDINYDEWRESIRAWSEISPKQRENHVFLENAMKIVEGKKIFVDKALPHLCSYLPDEADLGITIYFTAFIPPRAFAMGEIVINVSATYWNENADNILNTLVHEVFHVGYGHCRDIRTEEPLENKILYNMLDNFQNEGVCTYVGYKALRIFPAPDEKDYSMLEDPKEVNRLIGEINEVFSQVDYLEEDELQKLAWEKLVIGRGYYVVGAHMCRTIEEVLGRDALVGTLTEGPVSFVKLYNSIVEDGMRIAAIL